ncbi:Phthiocerol synthesis polyketide synthase type I PpsC [Allorhodopirellula heiligendammensis]|uniref:Phthiocerol synthesis polyketide synthase type I PpsC n=2 Tax=Allorhodopirellula heiligendammensis TaxID=2714739 RepID=A0A5C6C4G4_9BACT|nr:type I polyketide synthase [Allorhodopirellula heiligendammensis]TWU18982.1 Phthiocerol synthesis polyketide synthase type I PpsC [Allorhodopirellula heiligendammensis]
MSEELTTDNRYSGPETMLLTGATGMVGSYVMAQWLRDGRPLAVIARGKGAHSATERIEQILCRFEAAWSVTLPRPRVFQGDLNQPGLGLLSVNAQWIADNCSQILHSAASLSFAPASESVDNEPYRTNVHGTEYVLDFCRASGISHFHHISTAYVCGKRSGAVLESEGDVGQDFANDYERSKLLAEGLLDAALRAGTLESLTIYRPSIVIDRTGLSPISGDRTIYGAFSMYQMLASRFGLPAHGEWFRNLGFDGEEQKNIVDVDWIANAVLTIIADPRYHNQTYHLTSSAGTTVQDLDAAFHAATQIWLDRPTRLERTRSTRSANLSVDDRTELDRMAAPFVNTFLPYFRDDPQFDREQIDRVIAETDLPSTPHIGSEELLEMVRHWSAFTPRPIKKNAAESGSAQSSQAPTGPHGVARQSAPTQSELPAGANDPDEIVICGYEVRLPGGVDNVDDFAEMLWAGRSGIEPMPDDRLDRSLYFDTERNVPGKTYTQLGGCVSPTPLSVERERKINALGEFDLTHRQFAQVAMAAVESTFGVERIETVDGLNPLRAGVLVGHSGGTQAGGPLAMNTLASATSELIEQTGLPDAVDPANVDRIKAKLTTAIREGRPSWQDDGAPHFNAYSAASLTAGLIGFRGRREVIDAACSSSLLALHHAVSAITADHLDVALVGGATFNNVDNLALFSQSGACSDEGCYPFDRRASGLISSEGYVAVILVRRSVAERLGLPIRASVVGVGVASDGKGKGLWAPRSEGQQLAIRRVSNDADVCLDVDYLECHATSTQVGDATELETLTAVLRNHEAAEVANPVDGQPTQANRVVSSAKTQQLPIGSVKSNLGHLLEAAGLVGMVKCMIAMQRSELPPSIHFDQPNETYDWTGSPLRVVKTIEPWPQRHTSRRHAPDDRLAGINAFGIGGLNAHVVIRQSDRPRQLSRPHETATRKLEPIAIVGRGLVLPGAQNVAEFAELLRSTTSCISDPPAGRWPQRSRDRGWIGVEQAASGGVDCDGRIPHCRGGYIRDFQFDAQSYRIPPKTVQYANPAQLMLIDAAAQAIDEFDGGTWSIDRARVGVVVGTMFGGEFSNSLQIGLRLPEIRQHFLRIARDEGLSRSQSEAVVEQFHTAVMQRYPALLDETGGFTASTLASRISRTFDLMGGACAVDADEASGGLAIMTAMEQLRGGQVDAVLCGMTHRSMDLVAFEQLYRKNQLVPSGRAEDVPQDGSRIFPGEGVAIMMLQRLSDAVAQDKPIFGVIEHAAESWTDDVARARADDASLSETHPETSATRLSSTLGHLGGGQGIVRTLAATVAFEHAASAPAVQRICETAQDGYQIQYQIAKQPTSTPMIRASAATTTRSHEQLAANGPSVSGPIANGPIASGPERASRIVSTRPVAPRVAITSPVEVLQIRLRASDPARLQRDLRLLVEHPESRLPRSTQFESGVDSFQAQHTTAPSAAAAKVTEVAIVGHSVQEVAAAARAILDGPLAERQTTALSKHVAWIRCQESSGNRVGWLFPGQGSQYPAIPRLFSSDDSGAPTAASAWSFMQDVDARLQRRGIESVGDRLTDPKRQLGRDVWWTQLWVLAVGAAMTDALFQRGHRPDVVLGHSFGECTAAWAAGVMNMDQAIEFAKCRSDAVIMTRQVGGQLLSVRGEPSAVQAVIDRHQLDVVISHHNSPVGTVIAGMKNDIAAAKSQLADAGMASVVINVPAAFHTPAMKPAQELLRARFGGQHLLPPRLGFLSAVSNRYLAEPTEIMDNLINQLTQPVCFNGALQRIVAEGCGLLIEVGPDNVLTRLARASVDGRAICLSADERRREHTLQQLLIEMACEAFQGTGSLGAQHHPATEKPIEGRRHGDPHRHGSPSVTDEQMTAAAEQRFEVVDVTRNRRRQAPPKPSTSMRASSNEPNSVGSSAPLSPEPITLATRDRGNLPTSQAAGGASRHGAPTSPSSVETPLVVNAAVGQRAARAFLFDLAVDLTGYDPEIIDFSADLEAELGVDSIKKAQLIGEIVQWSDTPIDVQSMQLAQFETLNDILGILDDASATASLCEPTSPAMVTTQRQSTASTADAPRTAGEIPGAVPALAPTHTDAAWDVSEDLGGNDESLRRLMIDLVVDQTGYDESIIDLDADMEGELGIDSIKKAQLLGELAQQYQLTSLQDSGLTLADFATLESIRAFVWEQIASPGGNVMGDSAATLAREKKNEVETQHAGVSTGGGAPSANQSDPTPPVPATGTHRFVLGMQSTPRLANMPAAPTWHGPALVYGDNAMSDAIVARWRADSQAAQFPIELIDSSLTIDELNSRLDELWANGISPHLFITTPHDRDAVWQTTDAAAWRSRRESALSNPFRLCQRWMQGLIDANCMSKATLTSLVNSGGDFHFGGGELMSSESGGLSGLTKAMLIEAWMRGYQDTPMLIVDALPDASPADVAEGIWRELAVPSYDEEVAVSAERRFATAARYSPLSTPSRAASLSPAHSLTSGGNWIVAGGGRGITAMTAMELASRHQLKLHLLGTAPVPQIDDETRRRAAADRPALRRQVMNQTQAQGGNPVTTWQQLEKAIEIDQTLQACLERSIDAVYHSVDVGDVEAVNKLLKKIRRADGPIRGVIQGAGAGQDARFDRKRPDKVEKCFRAKIDGCVALANATQHDPLEWFVGFGSISGRFGANGHTDYSAANDMLAKLIGNLQQQRPKTRCVTFHWHAWGDIGMATKPEAKLALDMIGMDFMPAQEGLQHFINEIEWGGDATEVLITDRRYVRKFFPRGESVIGFQPVDANQTVMASEPAGMPLPLPMLDPESNQAADDRSRQSSYAVLFDPVHDRFLSEHLVQGRPTLPFVIAIELLAEAARAGTGEDVIAMHDIQAHRPLKCLTREPFRVELVSSIHHQDAPVGRSASQPRWSLVSDLRRRDGRLVEAARPHFSATILTRQRRPSEEPSSDSLRRTAPAQDDLAVTLEPVDYQPSDAPVYHGPALQCLRQIGFTSDSQTAVGVIVAPSPAHLAGEHRPMQGWTISPASTDALLYAAGMLAYRVSGRPSLPVSFERIEIGRLPVPGEPLRAVVTCEHEDETGAILRASLDGFNGDRILELIGYKIGWIG